MADYMSKQVLKQIQIIFVKASFFLSANEVITVDNQSWVLVHAYVMHAWKKIHILFTLQLVAEGGNANNLIVIIIQVFMQLGGLIQEDSTKRLICFGANGASIFQGYRTNVTFQLKEKFALCMMGQHCMAHQTNIVVQVLSNLPMVAKLEDLL